MTAATVVPASFEATEQRQNADDQGYCHLFHDGEFVALCGATGTNHPIGTYYTGQTQCPDCKKPVCPRCVLFNGALNEAA